jgi:hypothetical protein
MRLWCDGEQSDAGARGRQPSAIVRMRETKGNIMSDLYDLGKRAVSCKGWRWMPGMLASDAGKNQHRVIEHHAGREYITTMLRNYNDAHCESSARAVDLTPVLDDPATLGCLLALVRKAWNACRISICFSAYTPDETKRWSAPISFFKEQRDLVHVPSFYGSTQAGALVAALEAAP